MAKYIFQDSPINSVCSELYFLFPFDMKVFCWYAIALPICNLIYYVCIWLITLFYAMGWNISLPCLFVSLFHTNGDERTISLSLSFSLIQISSHISHFSCSPNSLFLSTSFLSPCLLPTCRLTACLLPVMRPNYPHLPACLLPLDFHASSMYIFPLKCRNRE